MDSITVESDCFRKVQPLVRSTAVATDQLSDRGSIEIEGLSLYELWSCMATVIALFTPEMPVAGRSLTPFEVFGRNIELVLVR